MGCPDIFFNSYLEFVLLILMTGFQLNFIHHANKKPTMY